MIFNVLTLYKEKGSYADMKGNFTYCDTQGFYICKQFLCKMKPCCGGCNGTQYLGIYCLVSFKIKCTVVSSFYVWGEGHFSVFPYNVVYIAIIKEINYPESLASC